MRRRNLTDHLRERRSVYIYVVYLHESRLWFTVSLLTFFVCLREQLLIFVPCFRPVSAAEDGDQGDAHVR